MTRVTTTTPAAVPAVTDAVALDDIPLELHAEGTTARPLAQVDDANDTEIHEFESPHQLRNNRQTRREAYTDWQVVN